MIFVYLVVIVLCVAVFISINNHLKHDNEVDCQCELLKKEIISLREEIRNKDLQLDHKDSEILSIFMENRELAAKLDEKK